MTMRVRTVRQRLRLSQRKLAQRADLAETTVSRIETGRMKPYPGQARRIVRVLGVEVTKLFPELTARSAGGA